MTNEQITKLIEVLSPNCTPKNRERFVKPLLDTCALFQINTPLRVSMFLAQLMHESGEMRYVKELASGEAYDTGNLAKALGNTPEPDGDGQKYKGRGLIQITGKSNYATLSKIFAVDLLANPEMLEFPYYAARSAGWYWNSRKLNDLADKKDLKACTKKINGGFNGLADREKYYLKALDYLKV